MADEVYEGAIGIDLGGFPCDSLSWLNIVQSIIANFFQAQRIHV